MLMVVALQLDQFRARLALANSATYFVSTSKRMASHVPTMTELLGINAAAPVLFCNSVNRLLPSLSLKKE
jgi:hypothetical protein